MATSPNPAAVARQPVDERVLVTRSPEGVGLCRRTAGGWQAMPISARGRWPAWNPTADLIAIRRDGLEQDEGGPETIELVRLDGTVIGAVHRVQPVTGGGSPRSAGAGPPAPLSWSPGGDILSYVSPGLHGDTLFLSHVDGEFTADPIIRGTPLYFAWCADNNFLAVHAGSELLAVETAGSRFAADIAPHAEGFRVPAYSDDAEVLAYALSDVEGEGGVVLMRALFQGTGSRPAHRFAGTSLCLAFQPGTQVLAIAVATGSRMAEGFDELWLQDLALEGQPPRQIAKEALAGFWWAPSGAQLAIVTPIDSGRYVVEVRGPEGVLLARSLPFRPSTDYLEAARYCDQVGLAQSFWSPASGSFLICGRPDGASDDADAVFVWRPNAGTPLEPVGPGTFATFRPPRLRLHG